MSSNTTYFQYNPTDIDFTKVKIRAIALLKQTQHSQTRSEQKNHEAISKLSHDGVNKTFFDEVTDRVVRGGTAKDIIHSILTIAKMYNSPGRNVLEQRLIDIFSRFGHLLPTLAQFGMTQLLKFEANQFIKPWTPTTLTPYIRSLVNNGFKVNVNPLGEVVLSETEALQRIEKYKSLILNPEITCVSIKLSNLFSQINQSDYDSTKNILVKRLSLLLHEAKTHNTFINLDMEAYSELYLTYDVFMTALDQNEFQSLQAGTVIQTYLKDSSLHMTQLTQWAKNRHQHGGGMIKFRIVKGANGPIELWESELQHWPLSTFTKKQETDASFKQCLHIAFHPDVIHHVRFGIGSHNIGELAYVMEAIDLYQHNRNQIDIECLNGMYPSLAEVIKRENYNMLIYIPIYEPNDLAGSLPYLVRRLMEFLDTANFMSNAGEFKKNPSSFEKQLQNTYDSTKLSIVQGPARTQNRQTDIYPILTTFKASLNTDWSLPQNQEWNRLIHQEWKNKKAPPIPSVINGIEYHSDIKEEHNNINGPNYPSYVYTKATLGQITDAISVSKNAQANWRSTPVEARAVLLHKTAAIFERERGTLLGTMMLDGKTFEESDPEISEAIDFLNYYPTVMKEMETLEGLTFKPKGTVVLAMPWNFPCAILTGNIAGALMTGNTVIAKPSKQTVLTAWHVVNAFWEAGISKNVLQFVMCDNTPEGSTLIQHPDVNLVMHVGGTNTAKHFLSLRPDLDLIAETGGRNSIIISAPFDPDLAVKDVAKSAFNNSGEKCSHAEVVIMTKSAFEDKTFINRLIDHTKSLTVGPSTNRSSKIIPLIMPPNPILKEALTTVNEDETWLLQPKQDSTNPLLFSPGIKLISKHKLPTLPEVFGPVLYISVVDTIQEAVTFANDTDYGLTSGIHTLDLTAQDYFKATIQAGNLYLNREITGAKVIENAFGGTKWSTIGIGKKAGGPNYLFPLVTIQELELPKKNKPPLSKSSRTLIKIIVQAGHLLKLSDYDQVLLENSVTDYAFHFDIYFNKEHDARSFYGQDNILRFKRDDYMILLIDTDTKTVDALRMISAMMLFKNKSTININSNKKLLDALTSLTHIEKSLSITVENETALIQRIQHSRLFRLKSSHELPLQLKQRLVDNGISVLDQPIRSHGRIELLDYCYEQCISHTHHRNGVIYLRNNNRPLIKVN